MPSHANVSDLPSRNASKWDDEACAVLASLRARMAARGIYQRELQLPTAAQLENPR